jgi:hypothetical protein
MDLLDNSLETTMPTHVGLTDIGRPYRCIRCDITLDDPDAGWCEVCHPKNGPIEEVNPVPPRAHVWLDEDDLRRTSEAIRTALSRTNVEAILEDDGLHWRSTFADGHSDGILQRDGHWRSTLDVNGWIGAGLRGNDLASTWLDRAVGGQIHRIELRQFSTDPRRPVVGPGHTITEWGWAIDSLNGFERWGWTDLDVFVLTARFAAYYAGTPGTFHDGYSSLLRRRRWTGATPIAVIEAFLDDGWLLP